MDWINIDEELPKRTSNDLYLVTDGENIGWSFFGCDDPGEEHDEFIGGDLPDSLRENITHWMMVILPNGQKSKPAYMR